MASTLTPVRIGGESNDATACLNHTVLAERSS